MTSMKFITCLMLAASAALISACGTAENASAAETVSIAAVYTEQIEASDEVTDKLTLNNEAWNYDKHHDVYWQIAISYCSKPETNQYETMGIYIPGVYMTAVVNDEGTYNCTTNISGTINGYNAATAPIVFPVNTPGYSAQAAPESYSYDEASSYLKAGFVYVCAGMRGCSNGYDSNGKLTYSGGAPWGVTDLKAAIRYYRFNQNSLPGNTDRIFTFGMSGGGAQSAITGATGDSALYFPYLNSIGAAMIDKSGDYISDAICGAMCWCPITSLDYADEAYEWNMGQYTSIGSRDESTWTSDLSKDLAVAYAEYINRLGLRDPDGTLLTLEKSDGGIYANGSYYNYLLSVVEGSLNNYLEDSGLTGEVSKESGNASAGYPGSSSDAISQSNQAIHEYIDYLNSDVIWVTYNEATKTAKITSMEAFVEHCKHAVKSVGAFDNLYRDQIENDVFGNDQQDSLHFDSVIADLLLKNKELYAKDGDWDLSILNNYTTDLLKVDKLGNSIQTRLNMYDPMYYLCDYYSGYQSSTVAPFWRIRSGINQVDTALTIEANLALALEQYSGITSVDFETVWDQGHTMAERNGDSTNNFIDWVNECVTKLE